jgi:thioredoxin-like negative regulator of GroEL
MKPDWDKLMTEYESSDRVVIADVDCTVEEELCQEHGIQGYPSIKYYLAGEAEDYEGGRSMTDLKKFVEESLMEAPCTSDNKDACSVEQLKGLEAAMALSSDDRSAKIEELKQKIKDANKAHEKLVEGLQAQYEESMAKTEKIVKDVKGEMKWLKAVKEPSTGKEEL